jgi:hypothetical protein
MAAALCATRATSRSVLPASVFAISLITANTGFAQGTPKDQYRQMGSIAAVAETCYGSKEIPVKIQAAVKRAASENPAVVPVLKELTANYNEAYAHALVNMTVWNGASQSYSASPFNCSDESDVELIRKFEATILENLH